jgi:hypothetical protein
MNEERRLIGDESSSFTSSFTQKKVHMAWSGVNTALIVLTLFILIVAISRVNKNISSSSNNSNQSIIQLQAQKGVSFKQGDIVSILQDGTLTKGGGMSVYRFTNSFPTIDQVKHLHSVYLPNIVVVCYYSQYAMLLSGKFDPPTNKIQWNTPVSLADKQITCDCLERMRNSNTIVIIGGNQAMPVTVSDNGDFTLGQVTQHTQGFSMDPRIAILSDTKLAISFYHTENDNTTLSTAVLKLSGASESDSFTATNKTIYSQNHGSHNIMAFSDSLYVLCHPKDNYPQLESGPLACMLASVTDEGVSLSSETLLNYVAMKYFFDLALVSPKKAVITFTDESIDNGIRGVVLELLQKKSGEFYLDFGSSIIINSGHGSGELPSGLWLYINIETISPDRFVVVYSDLSNEGRISATIGEISTAASLNLISPEFVLSISNPFFSQYYWIDVSVVNDNMFLIFDSLTGSDPASTGGVVAIVEMKNAPFGIIKSNGNAGSNHQVIVKGQARVTTTEKLIPGRLYYTNTKGKLIVGSVYGDMSELDPENYIIDPENTLILDSGLVGVAVTASEILRLQ